MNRARASLAVLVLAGALAAGAPCRGALPALVDGMVEKISPAVVNVSTLTRIRHEDHPLLRDPLFRWFFDLPERGEQEDSSLGSGVIVDAGEGYVLTNHHVIDKAVQIRVTLHDGRRLEAQLVGSDPETDVALLRIAADNLRAIPFGDSDQLRVGDFVVAVGSPFGLNHTVTSGIVSALGRSGLGIEGYESFIQTDASINPGNSGGPLVNLRGELVGINTAILAPGGGNIGISFAIPAAMARGVMQQLAEHGEVRRGHFGVQAQDLNPELAAALGLKPVSGAVLLRVEPRSPAAKAGLREGDLVVALDGKPVRNTADLRNRLALKPIGSSVRIALRRNGEALEVAAEIEDPMANFIYGEHLHPYLTGALLRETRDDTDGAERAAIEIGHVEARSNAWHLGLRKGDLLLEINQRQVGDFRSLAQELARDEGGFVLRIRRGERLVLVMRR